MDNFLHYIRPWMQKSIAKAEDRIKKKVAQQTKWKIQEVHQHLHVFELRVLARPTPTTDLTTPQEAVASLRADMDIILEMKGLEPETAPVETTKDTMLAALFTAPT